MASSDSFLRGLPETRRVRAAVSFRYLPSQGILLVPPCQLPLYGLFVLSLHTCESVLARDLRDDRAGVIVEPGIRDGRFIHLLTVTKHARMDAFPLGVVV